MNLRQVAERIETLAKDKFGNTQKMIEASDGVLNKNVVYNMKKENASIPNIVNFEKIAELLEVSTDYLLGKTEDLKPDGVELVVPEILKGVRLAFHRNEFEDLTQSEVDALAKIAEMLKQQRRL
ncbi:MAG: hypothetical protein LBS21_06775 [Clostridiales bacterium]|nr:hypothetical protein [Clostridiales bacterium]